MAKTTELKTPDPFTGPRDKAVAVASYARAILDGDKAGRRKLYEKLGFPPDESVR